jgi:hypothetical protein
VQTFTQAQLIVSIIVALMIGFTLGRLYQMAVSSYRAWREGKALVPKLRTNAIRRAGGALRFGAFTAVVVVVLIAGAFAQGMSN